MKLNATVAKSWFMAASIGIVLPVYAQTTTGKTPAADAKPPAKAPAKPGKPAKPQPAPAPAVETPEEIQLPGVVQPRPSGGFISVEVVDGKFKVSFYDAKKKQVLLDVARAAARWKTNKKLGEDHTVLSPGGDGKTLIGVGFVRPPFTFKLFLTLLKEDGTAAESYIIDMNSAAA